MKWVHVFGIVTIGAVAGMILGGAFGFASGKLTPDFFRHIIPWRDVEPLGFAIFLGATVGVLLGGGLACFALVIQLAMRWRKDGGQAK
jgi:hypothetical protein